MQRLFSLSLIALICLSVYVIRSGHAGASLQSAYTGPTPADCFSFPTELAKTHWACDAVLAVADIEDLHRAEALFFKGLAESTLGDKEIAVELYGQALALNPERRSAYYNRAMIHLNAKRFELAAQDALHVRDHWPERNDDWYDNQGIVFQALTYLGKDEEALQATSEFLEGRPDDVWGLRFRAHLGRTEGQGPDETEANILALRDISKAIALEPGRPQDHNIRAKVLRELAVIGVATSERLKSVDIREQQLMIEDPKKTSAEWKKLRVKRDGSLRRLDVLREKLNSIPENSDNINNSRSRAFMLFALGDADRAVSQYEELVKTAPDAIDLGTAKLMYTIREIFEEFDIASVVN